MLFDCAKLYMKGVLAKILFLYLQMTITFYHLKRGYVFVHTSIYHNNRMSGFLLRFPMLLFVLYSIANCLCFFPNDLYICLCIF